MGKITFTICTPIPMFIPREIAVQALHDHSQVIKTNPLVLEHKPITAPKEAAFDELQSAWYEIVERIQYVPGLGKMGSGKISFPGCFHDMPWGLQTHIHAPLSIDLRMQYRIAGEVVGVEAQQPRELGLAGVGAPDQGLYLRTDAEVKCNAMLSSFVRSQTKDATNAMVAQIVKNAERMDSDILARMITDERLERNATIRAGRRGSSQPAAFAGQANYPPVPPVPSFSPQPDRSSQSSQSRNPGQLNYAQQPEYSSQTNHPSQSRYSGQSNYAQQSDYSLQPNHPPQARYSGQSNYAPEPDYSSQTNYPQQSRYSQQRDYSQQGDFSQQSDYSSQTNHPPQSRYSQQADHSQQTNYPSQTGHATQANYPQQPEYSQQNEYGRPPVSPMHPDYNTQHENPGPKGQSWI